MIDRSQRTWRLLLALLLYAVISRLFASELAGQMSELLRLPVNTTDWLAALLIAVVAWFAALKLIDLWRGLRRSE